MNIIQDKYEVFDRQLYATGIVNLLKKRISNKRYKPITSIHFSCFGKIFELERLIYNKSDFSDYDSIVEIFTTASASGYYIDGYIADSGRLMISFRQDFSIDNITPDLIEFISNTIRTNIDCRFGIT